MITYVAKNVSASIFLKKLLTSYHQVTGQEDNKY